MRVLQYSILLIALISFSISSSVTVSVPIKNIDLRSLNGKTVFVNSNLSVEPGEPELPVFTSFILLPPETDMRSVEVSIDNYSEERLFGEYDISPATIPTNIEGYAHVPRDKNIRNGKDIDIYSRNEIFPNEITSIQDLGQLNLFKIVKVKTSLFRYNPIEKSLYRLSKGDINVTYSANRSVQNKDLRISADSKKRLQKLVVNYNEFIQDYENLYSFSRGENLTIIITSETESKLTRLDDFVEAKKTIAGFDVEVINEDSWGGGVGSTAYGNIRKWLQDNINTKGLSYVLIIGESDPNSSEVPMLYFPDYANWGMGAQHDDCESDWGYSQLTGDYKNDYMPELHVGRIPVYNNYSEIDKILQKTIDYFSASLEEAEWRYNALFGGPGYDAQNVSWDPLNSAYNRFIATQPQWDAFRCYSSMYATPQQADLVSSDITNTWASGAYGLVSWGAHGSATGAQGAFSSSGTSTVGNEYPSYVMCGSCSNATITTSDNLSYSILKNCGMGAIGGTEFTVVAGDMVWIESFVGYLAMDSLTIGATHTELLINDCLFPWLNRGPYVLYGDPSIGIYSYQKDPFVNIIAPDSLEQNSIYNIKWSDNIESDFKVELLKSGTVIEILNSSTSNAFDWSITEDYQIGNDYQFKVTCIDSNNYSSTSNNFSIIPEYIIKDFPYVENFDKESLPYKYEQSNEDDIDWTMLSGPTPSKIGIEPDKTGPTVDHSKGNEEGVYLYVEASDPNNPGKEASIITPKFRLTELGNPKLTFWVHMFSANNEMGTLSLDVDKGRGWQNDVLTLTGDHGDEWFKVEQDLSDYSGERVRFRFNGKTGTSWCSDICIDDIHIDGIVKNAINSDVTYINKFDVKFKNNEIVYRIPNGTDNDKLINIGIYNLQGRLIKTLINGYQNAGLHRISMEKSKISSGVYFCKINYGRFETFMKVAMKK